MIIKFLIFICLSIVVSIVVLCWIVSRPLTKIQLSENMFMSDIGALPDGLYTILLEESSVGMAAYSLSTPVGEYDKVFFLHHSQVPRKKSDGRNFEESFLIEKGRIIT